MTSPENSAKTKHRDGNVVNNTPSLQSVFLAAEAGKLYHYDPVKDHLKLLFEDSQKESLMGLATDSDNLYVGAKTRVYRLKIGNGNVCKDIKSSKKLLKRGFLSKKRRPDFHQMNIVNNCLYITATGVNEIWEMDLDLNLKKTYKVSPPRSFLPVRNKWNYNHLNSVVFHDGSFFVCLNWLTSKQYGSSGVAVLDKKMVELERFKYGWEAHNFSIIDGKQYVLCGSSSAIKQINHPHKAGLMVDGKLVFEHNPNSFFCKDFSADNDFIYIVGGSVNKRQLRHKNCGVIFILDRDYSLLEKKVFSDTGGFCGCLLQGKDLTKTSL